MAYWTRAGVAALVIAAAGLAGCKESKLTKSNFDQIKPGMPLAQVEMLLGGKGEDDTSTGESISSGGIGDNAARLKAPKVYRWKDGRARITVSFQNEKVVDAVPENLSP